MTNKNKLKQYPLLGKLSPSTNDLLGRDKESIQKDFVNHLEFSLAKDKYSATKRDYYKSIAYTIRDRMFERWIETQQTYYDQNVKRVYFISMEYMLGRLLANSLLNLDLTEVTKDGLGGIRILVGILNLNMTGNLSH